MNIYKICNRLRSRVNTIISEKKLELDREQKPHLTTISIRNRDLKTLNNANRRLSQIFKSAPNNPIENHNIFPRDGEKLYVICMVPRSGSTLLGRALASTNHFGSPGELFNRTKGNTIERSSHRYGAKNLPEYLDMIINVRKTSNNVFGVKTDYFQLIPFIATESYRERFNNAKYIYLTRKDVLLQAISRYKGMITSSWESTTPEKDKAVFNQDKIIDHLNYLVEMMASYEYLFSIHGINPLRICYEDIVQDINHVIVKIADFVGVEYSGKVSLEQLGMKPQATNENVIWREYIIKKTMEEKCLF